VPNIAIPAPPDGLWDLKFHQVAIYHNDPETAVMEWSDMGYDQWTSDVATLVGMEWGDPSQKEGQMWFNYDILPMEFEYVKYSTEFRHTLDQRDGHPPFISHMSTYVEDLDAQVQKVEDALGITPYHRFVTRNHQNPYVVEKEVRFKEAIYDTRLLLGFDVKMIQRVPLDYADVDGV
jgi:hypothetical protein